MRMAEELRAARIPVTIISDAAVGYVMERVDMVIVVWPISLSHHILFCCVKSSPF